MSFLAKRAQELGAQRGRGRERNQQRDTDRDTEHDGKFPEQAPDDSSHQQNRDKDGDQGRAHGEHGKSNFFRAAIGSLDRGHALFNEARDVFENDDGVVHHESGGDGERHERQVVEAVAQQIHDAERANER